MLAVQEHHRVTARAGIAEAGAIGVDGDVGEFGRLIWTHSYCKLSYSDGKGGASSGSASNAQNPVGEIGEMGKMVSESLSRSLGRFLKERRLRLCYGRCHAYPSC